MPSERAEAAPQPVTLLELDGAFERIAASIGKGSAEARQRILRELLARLGEDERRFLFGLVTGELRQGALEGLVVEAVARAAELPAADVRRAVMLAGDLPQVAAAVLAEGAAGLATFSLQLFRPIGPMLAGAATASTRRSPSWERRWWSGSSTARECRYTSRVTTCGCTPACSTT